MNDWQIQKVIRERLADFPHELPMYEQEAVKLTHPITKQSFCEIAAEHFNLVVKRNPRALPRIKRVVPYYPGLAQQLLTHFPDDDELFAIAGGWDMSREPRDDNNYMRDTGQLRDRGCCLPGILAAAEKSAARAAMKNDANNPVEEHLWEERVDALATLFCLFASPDMMTVSPWGKRANRQSDDTTSRLRLGILPTTCSRRICGRGSDILVSVIAN